MLSNLRTRSAKAKILLTAVGVLSVFVVSMPLALADLGPVTYNSQKVTFNLPGNEPASPSPVIWELTLWHDGVMEGRETGTQGQQLNIWVPNVDGCLSLIHI